MQRAGPSLKSSQSHWSDPGWLCSGGRGDAGGELHRHSPLYPGLLRNGQKDTKPVLWGSQTVGSEFSPHSVYSTFVTQKNGD